MGDCCGMSRTTTREDRSSNLSVVIRGIPSSFVRTCALQSTLMPALHGRNVPNCRPMADGGMRKCSAGACPQLGSGWGVAESAVPIRCTKPQLRLFIPWCAGASRHERLRRLGGDPGRESMSRTPIRGRNPEGWGEGVVALGLVPSRGHAGLPTTTNVTVRASSWAPLAGTREPTVGRPIHRAGPVPSLPGLRHPCQ